MPHPNQEKTCHLYWIHINKDINQGYIGVSNNPKKRFKAHSKGKYTVGNAIRKYRNKIKITIMYSGTRLECLELEEQMRPQPNIGWNQQAGGYHGPALVGSNNPNWKGGSFCIDCNVNIPNKGKNRRCGLCTNPERTQFKKGNKPWNIGINTYIVTHPCGKKEEISNVTQFCKEYGIHPSNFRKVAKGYRKQTKGFTARLMKPVTLL